MFFCDARALGNFDTKHRIWQGIPSIEVTKKGRIFLTFYSGGVWEGIGNYVLLVKSDDGKHFSEPVAVASAAGHRCYDPCLWIDPYNRLWLTWALAPDYAVYAAVCDDPDADVLKWSEPRVIGREVMMNKPIVRKNGEWLFPIAVWDEKYAVDGLRNSSETDRRAFAYRSIDGGVSFGRLGGVSAEKRSYDEHMLLELSDGSVAMYIRTTYGIAVSYSYDGGRTWTEARDSGIGGPCSRFYIGRLKSGRILLVNHVGFRGRNNMTAMLSEDDGKTWKYKLLLDGRDNVSYPDAAEADDGYIYITYDRERGCFLDSLEKAQACAREILVAKITEEDIIAGRLVSEGSRLKIVASKLGAYEGDDPNPYHEIKRADDKEITHSLAEKNVDEILDTLFGAYEINCMNMHKIDTEKTDAIIEKLEAESGDREALISELVRIIRSVNVGNTPETQIPVVGRVKEIIESRIGENITLDEIAEKMHMSKFYLCHLFRKTTNMTLTDWKNHLRVEYAKKLLSESDAKVTDIARACGFDSPSYFSETFKKSENIAPETYRALTLKKI